MITRGSKIKLMKPIGTIRKFDNNDIGKIFEIVDITENGNILYKYKSDFNDYNYVHGCMSIDECYKYFKECEDAVKNSKSKKKRTWSEWHNENFVYTTLDGSIIHDCPIQYRDNGKVVQIRTNFTDSMNELFGIPEGTSLRTKASCNKMDKFNFSDGLDIADYRMQIKLLQTELEKFINENYC